MGVEEECHADEGCPVVTSRRQSRTSCTSVNRAVLVVPTSLAYAELAGVPASVGLVTATAGLTAYAILGTRDPLTAAAAVVRGFHERTPLSEDEANGVKISNPQNEEQTCFLMVPLE